MDPPAETDRTTPDLLNRTDLRAQNVHTPAEKAAPAHTGTVCVVVHSQSFISQLPRLSERPRAGFFFLPSVTTPTFIFLIISHDMQTCRY